MALGFYYFVPLNQHPPRADLSLHHSIGIIVKLKKNKRAIIHFAAEDAAPAPTSAIVDANVSQVAMLLQE